MRVQNVYDETCIVHTSAYTFETASHTYIDTMQWNNA